jgi:hypothetical protein
MATDKKPMVRIHNTETGEIIDREMTAEEYSQHLELAAQTAELKAADDAKAAQKAALLERLGITAEEASILLS